MMDISYVYNDKLWKPVSTMSDNNSFFHSVFGIKTNKNEPYFDKHAKFRRMRWSTFLTYFENEPIPPCLADILANCLSVNEKYKDASIEDKRHLSKYVADIIAVQQPVTLEEIPILSAMENVNIVVLTDNESDPVFIAKPNPEILGNYAHVLERTKDVVLGLKGGIFSRLSLVDEDVTEIRKNNSTVVHNNSFKGDEEQSNNHLVKYRKSGSAGSRGVEFQISLLTVFLLNALQKLTNWRLSTENKQAGKFDDIVLELSDKSVILLQAKFKENRKITFDQFLSVNPKNDNFSLPKYFFSYLEVKNKFQIKVVIICTNTHVDKKSMKFLHRQRVCTESLLHYEDGSCSLFTFRDEIFPYLKQSIEAYYENNLQGKDIDEAVITDENINDFLSNLQFFPNYPPGNNFGKIVDKLLFNLKYSNNLWDKASFQDVYNKMQDWFKQPYGEYLTEARAKSIFCELRSDKYCEILEYYNVFFEHYDLSFTEPKRLFYITTDDGYLLHLIKVYRILQNNKTKVLYVNPNDSIDVQKQIIDAFRLPSYTFLIMVWSNFAGNPLEDEICDKLKTILEKYKYKKIILISKNTDNLTQQLGLAHNSCNVIKGSVKFDDLSKDTRERLLKRKNIIFQGYEVTLNELISKEMVEGCEKHICSNMLEKLVRNEKVEVGTNLFFLDKSVARYYIDREFKRETKAKIEYFSVDTILDVNEKVMIISDSAGMGKSTVLTKLAMAIKNKNPYVWVIKIELNDHTGILKDFLRNNRESINVTQLLNYKESTKMSNLFENFLFSVKDNIVLMLDGMDEISPDYTGLIVSLITHCQETSNFAKIFVTTRPHMTHELQANFQVKPFILQPFTTHNQVDFLTSYWMLNLNLDSAEKIKCEQYAEVLINKMSSWIKLHNRREDHFTAIPLHVKMLAEIFQDSNQLDELTHWEGCKDYLIANDARPRLPEKMNLTELYQSFIKKKRDVFIDKGNPSGNAAANQALIDQFNECLIYHRALAIEIVLEAHNHLFSCYQICDNNVKLNTLKIGIVQKLHGKFCFVHRTFAEYFIAESLLRELQFGEPNTLFQKFLIEEILSYPEYNVVRSFFDNCLQNVIYSLPSDIFENYQLLMYEVDLKKNRKFNLIHQMAEEGCISILQLLLKCMNFKIASKETDLADFYEPDSIVQNRESILGNTLNIIQYYIQRDGIDIQDESGRTPLHYATRNGHLEVVKFLIQQGADVNVKDFGELVPLQEAVKGGYFDITKFLIQHGADVKSKDRLGNTILYEAITENHVTVAAYILNTLLESHHANTKDTMIPYTVAYLGQLDVLKKLVEQGVNVNSKIGNDQSLIFAAARGEQLDMIDYLVRQGADVNCKDDDGNTALYSAASRGHLKTVKSLIECGADINIKNNEGRTVLHTTASWGHLCVVEFLVSHNADVNIRDSDGYTALYLAAEEGLLDVVRMLVEHGADINIRGNDNRTALFLAAMEGELETVKYLIHRNANINIKDNDGCTPLFLAAEGGELDTVKFLAKCGADINIKNNDGHTVLHLAILTLRQLDTIKFLVECGVDVNIRDNDGRTALFTAVKEGYLNIIKYLVSVGIDVNIRDSGGSTALHFATFLRQVETVKFLVECGIKVNIKDKTGWTALHLAISWGQLDVVKFFVEHDADIHVRGRGGDTPIFLAVRMNKLDVITFLIIELEVDVNTKNNIGRTPLHYAALLGKTAIVEFLTKHGADIYCRDSKGNTAAMLARRKDHLDLLKYLETENTKSIWAQFLCLQFLS